MRKKCKDIWRKVSKREGEIHQSLSFKSTLLKFPQFPFPLLTFDFKIRIPRNISPRLAFLIWELPLTSVEFSSRRFLDEHVPRYVSEMRDRARDRRVPPTNRLGATLSSCPTTRNANDDGRYLRNAPRDRLITAWQRHMFACEMCVHASCALVIAPLRVTSREEDDVVTVRRRCCLR